MGAYSAKSYGHVGDVIVTRETGVAHQIMAEVDDYLLVMSAMSKSGDWQAIRKSKVGPDSTSLSAFYVFLCPHGVSVSERLPEAAES